MNKDTLSIIPEKQMDLARKLNEKVGSVIGKDSLNGFEKAFLIANAIADLKLLLTAEYMKPIMSLQGNKLGFKTDKDDKGGYPEDVVKNCLIEAVLTGLQPFGNQFNIISGSMYGTKEGFGHLLLNYPGLRYEIIPALPRINAEKTGAGVMMKIRWSLAGSDWQEREMDFAVKMNQYMGVDGAIGKATRKARAWLFNTINGTEVGEGDVQDIDHKVIPITADELLILYENVREKLTADERKDSERIVFGKEETSFAKLKKLLESKLESK